MSVIHFLIIILCPLTIPNFSTEKIDLAELVNTDLTKVKEYFDELHAMEERKRVMMTENTWVWHDQDELLRFQDDYYYGYHSR